MKTTTYRRSVIIDAPIGAVYAFHENPHNLPRVSPPGLVIESIEGNAEAVRGERFRIRARQFFLPIDWEGVWDEVEHPRILVDRALRSPFARFRHSHIFESIEMGTRTRLTDQVEYALPLGHLGCLLANTAVWLSFEIGFRIRHRLTREWFAGAVAGQEVRSAFRCRSGWLLGGFVLGVFLAFAWRRRRR